MNFLQKLMLRHCFKSAGRNLQKLANRIESYRGTYPENLLYKATLGFSSGNLPIGPHREKEALAWAQAMLRFAEAYFNRHGELPADVLKQLSEVWRNEGPPTVLLVAPEYASCFAAFSLKEGSFLVPSMLNSSYKAIALKSQNEVTVEGLIVQNPIVLVGHKKDVPNLIPLLSRIRRNY